MQADLARSLQFMADEERAASPRGRAAGLRAARDAFYRGDLAAAMVRYHRDNGGWLTADDLAPYRSEVAPPVRTTFGGMEVLTCGPWCQGPVLLQMLSLLEGVNLKALFPGSFEPHPYHPGRLDLERSIGEATGEALAALGHRVQWLPDLSIGTAGVCAISADLEKGILHGGADPRRAARAMGW